MPPHPGAIHAYFERREWLSTVLCRPFPDKRPDRQPRTTTDWTQVTCRRCLRKRMYLDRETKEEER